MMHLSNRANQLQESAIRKLNSTVVQQNCFILQTQHWSTGCCNSPSHD